VVAHAIYHFCLFILAHHFVTDLKITSARSNAAGRRLSNDVDGQRAIGAGVFGLTFDAAISQELGGEAHELFDAIFRQNRSGRRLAFNPYYRAGHVFGPSLKGLRPSVVALRIAWPPSFFIFIKTILATARPGRLAAGLARADYFCLVLGLSFLAMAFISLLSF
jgi:hypothetical protein